MADVNRRRGERRKVERRAPKAGVTIRHNDKPTDYLPKRIRDAKHG